MSATPPVGEGPLDSLDVRGAVLRLPEQLRAAAERTGAIDVAGSGLPAHDEIANVVVLGSGTAGIAADLVPVIAGPFMSVPVVVHKGYAAPNFIGRDTLVLALSYDGDTEETLDAAETAALDGGRLVCVSGGGALAELALRWGGVHIGVPEAPVGRAALGSLAVAPLVLLESLGFFPGAQSWVDAAAVQLERRRDQRGTAADPATRLARAIDGTMPIVYGGGGLGAVAAERWKAQCNTSAKIPAWRGVVPDVGHAELAGWGFHGDITRQIHTLICLRHEFEHPQVTRRFALLDETLLEVVHRVEHVHAEGDGPLAQLFDLVFVGDLVTIELGELLGVDPGPVPAVDDHARRLAE